MTLNDQTKLQEFSCNAKFRCFSGALGFFLVTAPKMKGSRVKGFLSSTSHRNFMSREPWNWQFHALSMQMLRFRGNMWQAHSAYMMRPCMILRDSAVSSIAHDFRLASTSLSDYSGFPLGWFLVCSD